MTIRIPTGRESKSHDDDSMSYTGEEYKEFKERS
jgi:hypothetical protein